MSHTVLSHLAHGVRTITLNRPAVLNAMNVELVGALVEAFEAANPDPETRVILLTGAGRAFCAGADLKARRRLSRASACPYRTPPTRHAGG